MCPLVLIGLPWLRGAWLSPAAVEQGVSEVGGHALDIAKLRLSGRWFSGSQIIRMGLVLLVNIVLL